MGFPVPLDRWMRDGKSTIFSEVSDGRCKHFVDVDQFARDFDTLDALFIWRIHQIARWMKLYDL